MRWKYGSVRLSKKKLPASNTTNWFFGVHFRFWGKFAWFPMKLTPLPYHFFSCFLFHQEVCSSKNYRAFGFKLPDKKLVSLRRIAICQLECTYSIKICSFSFFRIRSAIAQQITSHVCQYCKLFGVFIRLELDVQLYLHVPPVWGKGTKFSSVPTKIMAMDVPTYACIKFK